MRMAERIREAVGGSEIATPSGWVRVTVSVGVAGRHLGMQSLDTLVGDADAALYRAKANGRNRVERTETSERVAVESPSA